MKRFAGALLTGSIAMGIAVGPVFASCECDIDVQSQWLTFNWHESCPGGYSTEQERLERLAANRAMYGRMAHAVAFAAACWRGVQADSELRGLVKVTRIELYQSEGRKGISSANYPDAITERFRRLDRDTVTTLYAIRLGSFSTASRSRSANRRWGSLKHGYARPATFDSLLSVTWSHPNCAGGWGVELFTLPPNMSPSGRFDVFYGLLVDRKDANRLGRILRQRLGVQPMIVPILATGEILSVALAE